MLKRKVKIKQIHLAVSSIEDVDLLVKKLKEAGYVAIHGLNDAYNLKYKIVGLVVDNKEKIIFQTSVTCMACWCNAYADKPLYASEALEHFDSLFIEQDEDFYNQLLESVQALSNRPSGILVRL